MGGQFQLLQKCHCCYFQHLPKSNFSSVTSSSGSVGSSGVGTAVLLSPIWDTLAQHPLRSPGLPHPALLRGAPHLLQTAQKIAKQDPFLLKILKDPFLLSKRPLSSTGMEMAPTVAFGFAATSSRQHRSSGSSSQLIH